MSAFFGLTGRDSVEVHFSPERWNHIAQATIPASYEVIRAGIWTVGAADTLAEANQIAAEVRAAIAKEVRR